MKNDCTVVFATLSLIHLIGSRPAHPLTSGQWFDSCVERESSLTITSGQSWIRDLTRLKIDACEIRQIISCVFNEECNMPNLPYKPSKLSKGPKGSNGKEYATNMIGYLKKFQMSFLSFENRMKKIPSIDKIALLQGASNTLVNDVASVLNVNGIKRVKAGKNKNIKELSDIYSEYLTALQDFDLFLENVMSILRLE